MGKSKKPEIRFKGFADEWEQKVLGEVVYLRGRIGFRGYKETDLVNEGQGAITFSPADIDDDGFVSQKNNKYLSWAKYEESPEIKVCPEDILFTKTASIGKVGYIKDLKEKATINPQIALLSPIKNNNNYFTFLSIRNRDFMEQVSSITGGSSVPTMSQEKLKKLFFNLPKEGEQENISRLFQELDNLIISRQRKYEKLLNMKKACLEKMFPRNGSNVPEIRFKGFTDAWEQRKFKSTVLIERGGSPRPIDEYITQNKNGLNWIKIGDAPSMGNYIIKTSEKIKPEGLSKTREVHPGDLILSNSMSFGKPYIMAINGCIHDGWLLIRNEKDMFDLKFLCHLLGSDGMLNQYKSLAAGSTVNNLNKELVGSTIVCFPNITEQKKIGDFLNRIDDLITLHQRELEKLKNIKNALLQKMFV